MNQPPTRALCLWPGLAGLWLRGQWSSLVLAVGFALLLNLALAGSFLWPDLPGSRFSLVAWPILATGWILSFVLSWKALDRWSAGDETVAPGDDTLFIQAQTEYLKGDWELCQQFLVRRLHQQPRDLESRLLLATVLRRCGEIEAAREQLTVIKRIDGWQTWEQEIAAEWSLMDQGSDEFRNESPGGTEVGDDPATNPSVEPAVRGHVRLGEGIVSARDAESDSRSEDADQPEPTEIRPKPDTLGHAA